MPQAHPALSTGEQMKIRASEFNLWFSEQFGATPMDFDINALLGKERELRFQLVDVEAKLKRHASLSAQWTAALYARNAFAIKGPVRLARRPRKTDKNKRGVR